jgi:hypothetical protein
MARALHLLVLALVVAAVAVAAGCGGDEAADPTTAWADDACGALSGWKTSVEDAVASVTDSPSVDSISAAAQSVVDATGALRDDLDDLGAPPTDAQGQTEDALGALTTSLGQRADAVQQALDTGSDSLSGLASTAAVIATQVQGAVTDLQAFLDAAADPGSVASEVVDAIEQSDACSELRGSGA